MLYTFDEMLDSLDLQKKANTIRKWSLTSTTEAGSGHPTSSLSASDICTVLFDKYLIFDVKNPQNSTNDRFILSKGHASPLLYSLWVMAGSLPISELKTLRKFGTRLEGHPTPSFPFVDVVTGSLGQGLSIGAGNALFAKKEKLSFKTYLLLGDGEMAEGSNWEAANFASYYKLNNLIAIVDVNRLGQSQETMFGHHTEAYVNRFKAFGWETMSIDGHNFEEIDKALSRAFNNKTDKPFAIIAKTKKGKGVSFLEDKEGWHGKAITKEELEKALKELSDVDDSLRFQLRQPSVDSGYLPRAESDAQSSFGEKQSFTQPSLNESRTSNQEEHSNQRQSSAFSSLSDGQIPLISMQYKKGEEHATREVYGKVLAQIAAKDPKIMALDAEVKNSTYSIDFMKAYPDRFIECFIAEQNMIGVALGLSKRGKKPFVSSFAAFLTRAFDQIRMAAISEGDIAFVGSHAGVSIGEDGPSQMGLEDIAMFGTLPDTVILHPADAVSTAKLIPQLATQSGISYLRTLRPKTPVLYDASETFTIGGSKILRQSPDDVLTIAACGITVPEALNAYELLQKEHISVRIVDCYCVKPIDEKTLKKCLKETKKNVIVTVEDHFEHGGLGDFVLSAVSKTGTIVEKLAVKKIAKSGTKDELMDFEGIDSKHIVKKVKQLL